MSDYRTLLAEQIEADWEVESETVHPYNDAPYAEVAVLAQPEELADSMLATRIPDLCPDCKGSGEVGDIPELRIPPVSCDHPNAPTIADLLRWGEAAYRQGVTQ